MGIYQEAQRAVLELFVEWKRNMEKSIGRKIKVLCSDNGGEYTSDLFLQLCHDEGIERHFTVRETPQQNGAAERIKQNLARKGLVHVIQHQYIKIFLG